MQNKLPDFTDGQMKVLHRTLVRAGEAVPDPGPNFGGWLSRSQLVIPAGILVGRMQVADPLKLELKDSDFRKYVLGFMTGLDCFTAARAEALEVFLEDLERAPNMPLEPRRMKATLRDMNRKHREGVSKAWTVVDRAYQRFNENIGLGRPGQTALGILFEELHSSRVFSGGPRAHEELFQCYEEISELLSKLRAGKSHPDGLIQSSIRKLEHLVTGSFRRESQYWFNEIMVKQYVRDSLIPHAVLNGYLDPQDTSDLLGAVWNFITDLPLDPKLLVCIPLLRHQPQKQGPRYASTADFLEEIKLGKLAIDEFPLLRGRLRERQNEVQDPDLDAPSLAMISEHPLIRLSHGVDFLPYLLEKQCKAVNLDQDKFYSWLYYSIFGIDPRNGIPAQGLSLALRLACRELLEPSMEKLELLQEMQDLFFRVVDNKFALAQQSLEAPFVSDFLQDTRSLDPFELNEALIDLILAGFYQPLSDWEEERNVAQVIGQIVPEIRKAERDDYLDDVQFFKDKFQELNAALEALKTRTGYVRFDVPSLRLWKVFSIDIVRKLNQIKRKQFFRMGFDPNLMVAVNHRSISELIEGKIEEEICTSLEEIAAL